MEHQLAILIPTRNRPGILFRTLTELLERGFSCYPLYIYDDNSDEPEKLDTVRTLWPDAHIIRSNERYGQAKGRNILMQHCQEELGLFLDDDCWPENLSIMQKILAELATSNSSVATFQYFALADGSYSMPATVEKQEMSSFLGGANISKIEHLRAVGGFRELFCYGCEEPELTLRLWMNGYHVEYFPEGIVVHNQFYTQEEKRDYKEYDYLYARNTVLMSSLNFPLLFGLPYGIGRSLRRNLYHKRNFGIKFVGLFAGIYHTFSGKETRRPVSWKETIAWARFNSSVSF